MKKSLLLLVLFLAACSSREIHTEIYTENTTEEVTEMSAEECTVDTDCILHDANYGWGCCWSGYCDAIDYSEDRWIALNGRWITTEKAKWCESSCGPAPSCPSQIVNTDYQAVCTNNKCVKIPK